MQLAPEAKNKAPRSYLCEEPFVIGAFLFRLDGVRWRVLRGSDDGWLYRFGSDAWQRLLRHDDHENQVGYDGYRAAEQTRDHKNQAHQGGIDPKIITDTSANTCEHALIP